MQTKSVKIYLADRIERDFNDNYQSKLEIGALDGLLPFEVRLDNIRVMHVAGGDTTKADTLILVDRVNANIDIWSLLNNKISINGFSLERPRIKLITDAEGRYTIYRALTRYDRPEVPRSGTAAIELANIEIIAPGVTITDGQIEADGVFSKLQNVNFPDPLNIENINAHMFLELSEAQRFWDIENLSARLRDINAGNIEVSGQVYNDDRYLEFNAFTFSAGGSEIRLNGEIDGVDLYRENLREQLSSAHYNVGLSSNHFTPGEFTDIINRMPVISEPLEFNMQTDGVVDSLWVDDFSLGVGESYFRINGLFENLSKREQIKYQFKISEVALRKRDVEVFSGSLDERQFNVLENLQFNGSANGSEDSLNLNLSMTSPYGQLSLRGGTQLKSPFKYAASFSGKNVNPGDLIATEFDTTNLTFDVSASGLASRIEDAIMELNASIYNSTINGIRVDEIELTSSLLSGFMEHEYVYRSGNQVINGSGWIDLSKDEPPLSLQGNARSIDLSRLLNNGNVPSSDIDFDYNIEMRGLAADRIQGRANIDVKSSILGQDSLQSHQLYMDLDSPDQEIRNFRLTSSMFDLSLSGRIIPSNILRHVKYWSEYARERFREEILLEGPAIGTGSIPDPMDPLLLDGTFKAKNLMLIQKYWPDFPSVVTDTQLGFNVNADSVRLLFSGKVRADSIRYNKWSLDDSDASLTASFRRDMKLKDFSNVDFETSISHVKTSLINMDSLMLDMAYSRDSLQLIQKVGRFSDDARLNLELNSSLTDSAVYVSVKDFFLGNNQYSWKNEATPRLIFNRKDELLFEDFSFKNMNEYLELKGILSPNRQDSLMYIVQDVNLERISELIDGGTRFSGLLNGNLLTRSLTQSPSVQGEMKVNRFSVQDRLVGDVSFSSKYNQNNQRFDTQIRVVTDPGKYTNYLEVNDDIGQDIVMNGYFIPPDPDTLRDTLYDFDVRFNEIDMWVLPLFVKVFDSMEGSASGQGYLRGDLEDFDFNADFKVSHVFAKPRFLETNYFLNGHVILDRQDGVIIDSVDVTDTQGGSGLLWGTVDLNDFKPITFLDLSLSLNRLQFLNNNFDPDTPFYGTVAGSGLVRLTGANTDLYLRTIEPINVTDQSGIYIPLIEETELNQNNKFIQFVDSFDLTRRNQISLSEERVRSTEIDNSALERAIDDLTFNERFDMDLQFNASDNVNVDLIFDPVTGEVLTANGTGQLRITMQDEDVQMFGNYNIAGGSYQFVSGEIFTRRLDLESGGSISWQGDPDNARLSISAVYRARPSINTLNYQSTARNFVENGGGQRVPVDLIVEINGTMSSVENNYYFRLPNSLDISSNSTLSFAISQINRDEQQKLLQATSILLTGNFIPTQSYNQATSSLSQSLTRGSTVINPLLSNQVISPLLSNQMNALLNSDVSRFDIDFNLNAYNEIDLGIALRLYNDKLIFRREGQITGGNPESTLGDRIGDLNATYQINKGLSLTAFHRQDQTLGTLSRSQAGDVTPSVDGIGLEAKVQFNTWQDLGDRIRQTFKSFLGLKPRDSEKEGSLASDQPIN